MSHLCEALCLPALSLSSPKLLNKMQADDIGLKEFADCLKLDPGLCARLLRVANSPFFGVSGQISSVEETVMLLGMRRTRQFVTLEVLKNLLQRPPWDQVDLKGFWQRAVVMAACADALAHRVGFTDCDAFTAGLFYNVGCLALLPQAPTDYLSALSSGRSNQALLTLEQMLFETNHADMGSQVLAQWNFPQTMCVAVGTQYMQPFCDHSVVQQVLQFSHVVLSNDFQPSAYHASLYFSLGLETWKDKDYRGLLEAVHEQFEQWKTLLGM